MPDKEPRILARRIDEHRANMQKVIDGIRDAAERGVDDAQSDGAAPPPGRH
jgi:hypothetical protein